MAEPRYEREIDELLRRLESEHRVSPRQRSGAPWAEGWSRLGAVFRRPSVVERLMALAVVAFAATFVLGVFAPRFAFPAAALGLGCFTVALGLSLWHGVTGKTPPEARPRAARRRVEGPAAWECFLAHLRGWWRRRKA